MIVLKFGGTSVQDAAWIDRAISIAENQIDRAPVLVASAMGKTTNALVSISELAQAGQTDKAQEILSRIQTDHENTAKEFLSGENLEAALKQLDELFQETASLVKGLTLLRECTPRSSDALLSFGERLSTLLIFMRARERGIPAELLDSRDFMKTDESFMNATPIFHLTNRLTREQVHPSPGRVLILQGFIASTEKGVTSTLGRGGSDFTATIVGAALKAEEVQIWTDVDGIMTSDPRIVPDAITIPEISYEEAAELAYFGAKVVHPSTIQPAVELGIPVLVKNTRQADAPGTVIRSRVKGHGIRAIAGKKDITLLNVTSSRMLNAYGFLSRIFSIFEKHRTPVDLVATSEVSVSMTIENDIHLERIQQDLSEIGTVTINSNSGIICLVGQQLWKDPGFITRVFEVLTPTPIRMVSLGSSDINLSLVVPADELDTCIRKLHKEFFP